VHGEDSKLVDVMPNQNQPLPDNNLINESLKIEIQRALNTLSLRERDVLKLYYGLEKENPLTLEEIGEKFKLTRERVRQIKEKAIRRLKHASKSKILKAYLG
jgi:RNA polymerase primary sigma factor